MLPTGNALVMINQSCLNSDTSTRNVANTDENAGTGITDLKPHNLETEPCFQVSTGSCAVLPLATTVRAVEKKLISHESDGASNSSTIWQYVG